MGGRGSSSSWGGGGGGGVNVADTRSLISAEGKASEITETLQVLKDVEDEYGVILEDVQLATLNGASGAVMAYYDSNGNLAVNESYFNAKTMNDAYDACVQSGFHPSRGDKTGLEAVVAHEMGHRLTDAAGINSGGKAWDLDKTSNEIVEAAAKKLNYKNSASMASKISGYAKESKAECVAEAFADVYCNGKNAKKESRAVVTELNKYFKK